MLIANNAPDFKDGAGLWVKSHYINPTQHRTSAYNLWMGINNRCRAGKSNSAYSGVQNLFKDFQEFAEWCNSQTDYGRLDDKGNRWQLDKDLFGKDYSLETCVFIPAALNTLLKALPIKSNDLSIGVTIDKSNNRKQVYSVRYFRYKQGCTGRARFYTAEEAGKAWLLNRKQSLIEASNDLDLSERVRLQLYALAQQCC